MTNKVFFLLLFLAFANASQAQLRLSFFDTTGVFTSTVYLRLLHTDGNTAATIATRYDATLPGAFTEKNRYRLEIKAKDYQPIFINNLAIDSAGTIIIPMQKGNSNGAFIEIKPSQFLPIPPPIVSSQSNYISVLSDSGITTKPKKEPSLIKSPPRGSCNMLGTVIDEKISETLAFASINLVQGDSIIYQTESDFDGKYSFNNIAAGTYDVWVSYVGYPTLKIKDFEVLRTVPSQNLELALNEGVDGGGGSIAEVMIVKKHRRTAFNNTTGGVTLGAEDIARMPSRDISALATTTAGLTASDEGEAFSATGSRSGSRADAPPTISEPKGGKMTVGESRDSRDWKEWLALTKTNADLKKASTTWGFQCNSSNRYPILLTDKNNKPLADAELLLLNSKGDTIWAAHSDNKGSAELWCDSTETEKHSLKVNSGGQSSSFSNLKIGEINSLKIELSPSKNSNIDICFVVDATGSMGDEMTYLSDELQGIFETLQRGNEKLNIHLGTVYYRDISDSYLTVQTPMSADITRSIDFVKKQKAGGGGDFPEAVHSGLDQAINDQAWRKEAYTRIIFLVLDAPPHKENVAEMQARVRQAAAKGIKIVPITASGIDKETEFLMRHIALATNGSYIFITDHSGLGNEHLKASKKKFEVEFLNAAILRLIREWSE